MDKGNGIVIMNITDYTKKMNEILKDTSKFNNTAVLLNILGRPKFTVKVQIFRYKHTNTNLNTLHIQINL